LNTLNHDSLLFNVHDLVLLMAASQYLLLAALLFGTRRKADYSGYLLIGILLVTALQAIDTLLIWSDPLRELILDWNPSLLLSGSFSYWLLGPLLYAYVVSVLYRDVRFRRYHLIHLVPAVSVTLLLLSQYHWRPREEQLELMASMDLMWTPMMSQLVTLWHLSVIAYGSYCLFLMWRYRRELQQQYANVEQRERGWLTWIILGFVVIAAWKLMVHLGAEHMPDQVANILGVASNYMTFVFVNSLVFISIRYTHLFSGLDFRAEPGESVPFKPEQVKRVEAFMARERPHLEADVSMESLARRLSLPERTLSRILNQHFGKNFFEFINHYRVEAAKRLLDSEEYAGRSMLDILAESGFTSKSTFNAVFKKQVGQTPSQYRKSGPSA